eukprot:Rhum_TRINITY_DN2796_c0_g1::Rhum_TRINITY_DN2796_c0_g1_i1::g.8016::m.8016
MMYGSASQKQWVDVRPQEHAPAYDALRDRHLRGMYKGDRMKRHMNRLRELEARVARGGREKAEVLERRRQIHGLYSEPRRHGGGVTPSQPSSASPRKIKERRQPRAAEAVPNGSAATAVAAAASDEESTSSSSSSYGTDDASGGGGDAVGGATTPQATADAEAVQEDPSQSPSSASRSSSAPYDEEPYEEVEVAAEVTAEADTAPSDAAAASPPLLSEAEVAAHIAELRGTTLKPDYGGKALGKPARIAEYLYLSDGKAARNVKALEALGVTQVVNLAPGQCRTSARTYDGTGVAYVEVQAADEAAYPLLQAHLEDVAAAVGAHRERAGATLVHCFQGVNRSAALVVACLMKLDGVTLKKAVEVVHGARPVVLQGNDGFLSQLIAYAHAHALLDL